MDRAFLIQAEGRNVRGTYKCLVCVSRSSPGEPVDEIGIGPESWLSAKSSQKRSESRPIDAGILPVKLFEFSALQRNYCRASSFQQYSQSSSRAKTRISNNDKGLFFV